MGRRTRPSFDIHEMDVTEANRRHFISSTESLVLVHWHKHMCLKIDTSFISGDIGPFLPCGLWPAGDFVWGARRLLAPLTEKGPLSSLIKLRGTRVGGQGLPVEPAPLRGQPPLPSRVGHGGLCRLAVDDWLADSSAGVVVIQIRKAHRSSPPPPFRPINLHRFSVTSSKTVSLVLQKPWLLPRLQEQEMENSPSQYIGP